MIATMIHKNLREIVDRNEKNDEAGHMIATKLSLDALPEGRSERNDDLIIGNTWFLTLDMINSYCEKKYSDKTKKIIVIVLARYDLGEVQSIIRQHYDYWDALTGEQLDFFWLEVLREGAHNSRESARTESS